MKWFNKEVTLEALDEPVSPSSVFGVMQTVQTESKKISHQDTNILGQPQTNGNPSYDFTTQDEQDAAKIYAFCKDNGFQFFANVASKPFKVSLFDSLRAFDFHKLKHGFVAEIGDGQWAEIGQYNTSRCFDKINQPMDLGTGLTYARIVLGNPGIPYIRLDSKNHGARGKGQTADSLEGNFNQTFDVHTSDGAQTDLRYILTPDVMSELLDNFPAFDFELSNGCLFVLMPRVDYWESEAMEQLLSYVENVYQLFARRLANYRSEVTSEVPVEPHSYEKMMESKK